MLAGAGPGDFAGRIVRALGLRLDLVERALERLAPGPLLLLANRPYGLVEGCALQPLLAARRGDLLILDDRLLEQDPDAAKGCLGPGSPAERLARAAAHLASGGAVLAFVGPGLGHGRLERGQDRRQALALACLARESGAAVQALRLSGGKRRLFLRSLGLDKPGWRRVALGRAFRSAVPRIGLTLGAALPAAELALPLKEAEAAELLALRFWLLSRRGRRTPRAAGWPLAGDRRPLASAVPGAVLERELQGLGPAARLAHSGDLECWVAGYDSIPNIMREIGRVREQTFRSVGEGTGLPLDLDRFDRHYRQLFLWSRSRRAVVGGYRFAELDAVLEAYGPDGLYTHSLLRYAPELLERLGPALELGRSFVAEDLQRSYVPLQLLWRGIGSWVADHPRHRLLFGLVSMSADYQGLSRELAASFIKQHLYRGDLARLARPRRPYLPGYVPGRHDALTWRLGGDLERLSQWISEIEPDGKGLPVLFRQYARLGGFFFGFNVDPQFGGALDALVCVDLARTEPRLLQRHLGAAGAARFLARQAEGVGA